MTGHRPQASPPASLPPWPPGTSDLSHVHPHPRPGAAHGARPAAGSLPRRGGGAPEPRGGQPRARRPPGAYTMIAPNENRRSQIQRIAEQELKNLEKWKEQHRAKPVNLVPRRLGGSQSQAEVRQKQQLQLMQSKYQQKLKREESVRIKKEAEEAQIQKMKAIQREKSNKLEEKKRFQENLRREAFREHHQYKTAEFLSRLDTELPDRSTRPIAFPDPQSSTWARSRAYKDSLKEEENKKLQKMKEEQHQKRELLEFNQQQQEEARTKIHQAEHRRVNNVFLDRLQGKSQPGGLEHFGGHWNMNSGNSWDV
ncbi:epithelial-stromal interaction protein 1-like isoform X5 [Canis lupus familiaris]|uniref:epithelial-stromal interaction protein 1-like n=1 Tax=Canis lupus dingo TaxID=286419 RepID=UPI0003AE106A|nr:epithelial-stromal interaction protein 1-like [Canis lupus dingo]XP_038323176.1 epithelial-stromal interaction protein 1-like isoform X5 [Canis lupus familiaris]XP_038388049.1 epithelial-stromal interaction protein 1-like isoform X4 [Canis lupus familiaris]